MAQKREMVVHVPTEIGTELAARAPKANPAMVYIMRLQESGRPAMRCALRTIAGILQAGVEKRARTPWDHLPWHLVSYEHTQVVRAELVAKYGWRSTNRMLCALRGVLKEAWRMETMDDTHYHRAIDVASVKNDQSRSGRALTAEEFERLLVAARARSGLAAYRDPAVVAVMYAAGLRRVEVTRVTKAAYDPAVGGLTIKGKGGKVRTTYLPTRLRPMVHEWIARCPDGPLFPSFAGDGSLRGRPLSLTAIHVLLSELGREAQIGAFTTHDLRRSFCTHLLESGADLVTVQHLMGHGSPTTTAGYDRRGEDAKRRAVEAL